MSLTIIVLVVGITIALLLYYVDKGEFTADIDAILGKSFSNYNNVFDYDQLLYLPKPVQKYLKFAIPEGTPDIDKIHIRHHGRFKIAPDKKWIPIAGDQYFITKNPGFIWRGKTTWFTAVDRYFPAAGKLTVKLFSLIPIVNATGTHIDEGELQRWVSEHFWFPTNLLNRAYFQWHPIDHHSCKLVFTYQKHVIPFIFHFYKDGAIKCIECKRYKDKKTHLKWSGMASDYKRINHLMVPTRVRATWHLPEGDYTYADFQVDEIEYLGNQKRVEHHDALR
jgi:hypothetical protein